MLSYYVKYMKVGQCILYFTTRADMLRSKFKKNLRRDDNDKTLSLSGTSGPFASVVPQWTNFELKTLTQ